MGGGKNILVVCDSEEKYVRKLSEVLNRRKRLPFEIQAFTEFDALCEFLADEEIEVLLIGKELMCERIREFRIHQIIILSENGADREGEEYISLFKYQSVDQMIRTLMDCCSTQKDINIFGNVRRGVERIAVYSPVGRTAKTSFALTLAQIIAREKSVLYINMEEYAGFEQFFSCRYERNLGDMIYYIRQNNKNLALKLGGMIQTVNNLDYLPPAMSPLDIQNTKPEEWGKLFEVIENGTSYRTVILDIGDGVNDIYTILRQSSRVYLPIRQDFMAQAKIAQFEELLRVEEDKDIRDKIKKIKIPYHRTDKTGKAYLDELIWGELGDFVREIIREEDKDGTL